MSIYNLYWWKISICFILDKGKFDCCSTRKLSHTEERGCFLFTNIYLHTLVMHQTIWFSNCDDVYRIIKPSVQMWQSALSSHGSHPPHPSVRGRSNTDGVIVLLQSAVGCQIVTEEVTGIFIPDSFFVICYKDHSSIMYVYMTGQFRILVKVSWCWGHNQSFLCEKWSSEMFSINVHSINW